MAAYPTTIHQSKGTVREIQSGLTPGQADDGTIRTRSLFSETHYLFRVLHHSITDTERDTLLTFFETNKTAANTFVYDGDSATYDVYFSGNPEEEYLGHNRWALTMVMHGTKQ